MSGRFHHFLVAVVALLCTNTVALAGGGDTWVFVHGAWGGGWDWKKVTSRVEAAGHTAYRPTLTGLGSRAHLATRTTSLSTHITDIVALIESESLDKIVLVGHSYGGMVITGVADRIPERIKRLIYIDAVLPRDGESMMQLRPENVEQWTQLANSKGDGWRIPPYWKNPGRDTPQPLATFTESISLTNDLRFKIPAHYILTVEPGKTWDRFSKFSKRAKALHWQHSTLEAGHNPQRTQPDELIEVLRKVPQQ